MDRQVATDLANALRSGTYRQGKSALRRRSGLDDTNLDDTNEPTFEYCCLGVLCDISKQGEWDAAGNYRCGIKQDGDEDVSDTDLPEAVRKWAGMSSIGGAIPALNDVSLIGLNDGGLDFNTIALIIKGNYDKL